MKVLSNPFSLVAVLFVAAIFSQGCARQGPQAKTIEYGLGQCLQLEEGEKEMNLDERVLEEYRNCCFVQGIQAPLSKAFGNGYSGFLAMGLMTDPVAYMDSLTSDPAYEVFSAKKAMVDSVEHRQVFAKRADHFIFKSVYTNPKMRNTHILNIAGPDSSEVRAFFDNDHYLQNKYNCAL